MNVQQWLKVPRARFLVRATLLSCAVVTLVALARLPYSEFDREQEYQRRVTHTYLVLYQAGNFRAALQQAGTSQRRFLTAGDSSYLPEFRSAAQSSRATSRVLRKLTADNPEQQRRLDALDLLVQKRLELLEENIGLRKAGKLSETLARVRLDMGMQTMTECDLILKSFEDEERLLLDRRSRAAREQVSRTRWVLALGGAYLLVLLVVGGILIERGIKKGERDERQLVNSAERLRLALEAAEAGIWEWDSKTDECIWSEELWELSGIEPHSSTPSYKTLHHAVHPDDQDRTDRMFREAARAGRELNVEFRVADRAGQPRWLMARGRPLWDKNNPASRFAGIVLDITRRKRAEAALRESEQQFRTLANAIPQLCWMANPDGWIFWYNQRWYDYTGTTPEQMEGWGWQSVHDPDSLPLVLERWRFSIACGEPFDMVFPLRGSDGIFRPFLTRIVPLRDPGGKIARWFGTNTDITQQQQTESALREASEQRRIAMEAAALGACEYRFQTDQVIWDELSQNMFGLTTGQPLNYAAAMERIHPEDRHRLSLAIEDAHDGPFHQEFRVLWPDGTVRRLACHGRIQAESAQGVRRRVRLVGVNMDVTETREAQEQLLVQNTLLEAMNRVFREGLRSETEPDLRRACVTILQEVTASEFGLFGDLESAGNGHNEGYRRLFETAAANPAGFYTNRPDTSSAERPPLPHGHAVPQSFLGAPLLDGGKAIAVIGLFNRPGGFRAQDLTTVRSLAPAIVQMLLRLRDRQALRDSEERFRALVENASDAFFLHDLQGRFVDVNRMACKSLGYSREELLTLAVTDVETEFNLAQAQAAWAEIKAGHAITLHGRQRRKDGSVFPVEVRLSSCMLAGQRLFLGLVRDVTERLDMERALRDSEARFRSTFTNAAVGMAHVAVDGRWLTVNQRLCEIAGYPEQELLELSFGDITHADDLELDWAHARALLSGTIDTFSMEKRYWRKDKSLVWVNLTVSLQRTATGEPQYFIAVIEDISARRLAEEAMRVNFQQLQATFDGMVEPAMLFDSKENVIAVNSAYLNLFEYGAGPTTRQQLLRDLDFENPDGSPFAVDRGAFARARQGQTVRNLEMKIRVKKTGCIIHVVCGSAPIRDANGQIAAIIVTYHDITERKRAEVALERSNHALRQFAYAAAHDLQEPLRNVIVSSELLKSSYEKRLDREASELLEANMEGAKRMHGMIRDLLAYTRVIEGIESLPPATNAAVALAKALNNLARLVEESGAEITAGALPALRMHEVHLTQLFQNLIANSIKYRHPDRPPQIHIKVEQSGRDWVFTVRDNGIGFDPAYGKRIFGLFKRLHGRSEYQGTGIGLAICSRIVEHYGGRIWADSVPGEGSAFYFALEITVAAKTANR